ncbi:hypothetical protein NE237_005781 [Protea cynaroides]|uniref:OTU1-like C-terminal C2H2-type zinc finger domain-containing protein n=1 Tax=Protea cynaroides TaxID=273540 RepID=A0A9Q0KL49_9MAGN|nr:hypothetical protein NE237_005781 [Protea cynaroides]
MAGLSLKCRNCGVLLKSVEEAQGHAEFTSHSNFAESMEAVLNHVCNSCGNPCRSRIADLLLSYFRFSPSAKLDSEMEETGGLPSAKLDSETKETSGCPLFSNAHDNAINALDPKRDGGGGTLWQSLAGSTFDSSQLVLTASMGYQTVNEARLCELREKHSPSVIAAMEERSKVLPEGLGAPQTNGDLCPLNQGLLIWMKCLTGDAYADSLPDLLYFTPIHMCTGVSPTPFSIQMVAFSSAIDRSGGWTVADGIFKMRDVLVVVVNVGVGEANGDEKRSSLEKSMSSSIHLEMVL